MREEDEEFKEWLDTVASAFADDPLNDDELARSLQMRKAVSEV